MDESLFGALSAPVLASLPEWKRLKKELHGPGYMQTFGLTESQRWHALAALGRPLLIVTATDQSARTIAQDLALFLRNRVAAYPVREESLQRVSAMSREREGQAMQVLCRLLTGELSAVVTSVDALLQPVPDPERFRARTLLLQEGEAWPDLAQRLHLAGYERVEAVEGPGQYAVRGGILDVHPVARELPCRVELFGDEIESLREFDPLSQRSTGRIKSCTVAPASSLLLEPEEAQRGADALEWALRGYGRGVEPATRDRVRARVRQDAADLRERGACEGLEAYAGLLLPELHTLGDYCPQALAVLDEPGRIAERAENLALQWTENAKALLESGEILPAQAKQPLTYAQAQARLLVGTVLGVSALTRRAPGLAPREIFQFEGRGVPAFHGQMQLLAEELQRYREQGYRVVLLTGGRARGERLVAELEGRGVQAHLEPKSLLPGMIAVLPGSLSKGFEYPETKLAVLSDGEIYGVQKKLRRARKTNAGQRITSFADIKEGDYVVHDAHGVGVYQGIVRMLSAGVFKDYLLITYQGNDKLYVPTDQMDRIQKYIGGGDRAPQLNRLGGGEWNRAKSRVREGIKKLAYDLVQLYAKRQMAKGFAFGPDTPWQQEFEEAFPYEETPDQLAAIEDVKRDMESPRPMDRLLCGDVGYGKTEVAMRAAMKAVMAGKQVAILVPTTILAQQHYATLASRFASFPVRIRELSRFRTQAEQKAALAGLASGEVDIVVGTHRLLAKDVAFHDLGLLIIDEEQRFGVGHKEKIKAMKGSIDVLSMSATPIPRTLHMSMVGIRDISTIETPPEDRYPVQTFVLEYNESLIREAVARELNRGGQCYYVFNRVEGIDRCAARLAKLVPEARIAVAHGQMHERALEEVMRDFLEGDYDVLLSTTIIESGLDIPNANTLIIENADHMGLSQLYQLRGRVGRSNRLAYAYFTFKRDKVLTEVAEKRLAAIREFTQFGAGFKIAMRDLQIRGAGNLLGPEQHGQLATVGYDMYCRLMEDTIRELRGEAGIGPVETTIEVLVPAFLPDTYIAKPAQKVELYRRIAGIRTLDDQQDVIEEMIDRFGDPPEPAMNLVHIAYFKALASAVGISSVLQRKNEWVLRFDSSARVDLARLVQALQDNPEQAVLSAGDPPSLLFKGPGGMDRARRFLERIT